MNKHICLFGILLCIAPALFSQQVDSTIDKITQFPNRLFARIKNRSAELNLQLTKQTEKYLEQLAKREAKLEHKLAKKDSTAAKGLFAGVQEKYQKYEQAIQNESGRSLGSLSGEYIPYMDSLKGTLSFLNQNKTVLNTSSLRGQVSGSLAQFNQLQGKLQLSEEIKRFVRQRKQVLSETLSRYTVGFAQKYMDQYNKELFYYSAQLKEYRETLADPDKLELKALGILNQLPAFQEFMKNNSQLAGLFNIPENYGSPQGLDGLQTKDQVQQLIQGQVSSGGAGGASALESNLQSAHQQLDQFKDKLSSLGGGSGDIEMPNFTPNNQKTRPFLKRLELGTNLQTTRTSYFFPTTTDIGLSIGYKLNNKLIVGVGGSYKMGWGSGINHIVVSSQGVGIRSFIDMKLKGSFYMSGGYEENYQQPFRAFTQINSFSAWQSSGLIGVSKMVSFPGKFIKKTKMQLLWDFLSYYQLPRTDPIKFRVAYNF